jgi:glycosyltransferase involved in cell wall biosynthesis
MLALDGLCEVIVVNDGSTDDTVEVCAQFDDERLRLVTHSRNRGVATARNTGVANSRGSWVLFGEDDCRFPPDYAVVLRDVAERQAADIVGAPLIHMPGPEENAAEIAARAPRRSRPPTMDESSVFPTETVQTPFLPAVSLVRRSVFDTVSFYEGYPGNAYREETDFFVQAARGGFCCVLTPDTYCYQLDSFSGGQHHSSPLRYEYWALRNNWSFLRRHGSWLTDEGYIGSKVSAQARFVLRRLRVVSTGMLRARLRRLRAARGYGHA